MVDFILGTYFGYVYETRELKFLPKCDYNYYFLGVTSLTVEESFCNRKAEFVLYFSGS